MAVHLLGFFVNAFCALLLVRAATGTDNSRFLLHLAMTWALFALDRMVLTIGPLLIQLSTPEAGQPDLSTTLQQVDALIDISASFFLFLGSFLIFEYPQQRVPRVGSELAVFTLGLLALIATLSQTTLPIVKVLDAITSTLSVIFLGASLIRIRRLGMDRITDLINVVAVCFVFSNALLQPLWFIVETYPQYFSWYYPTLSASSLLIVIFIVVFSIRFLPAKNFPASQETMGKSAL